MNREIKFRAWDRGDKTFRNVRSMANTLLSKVGIDLNQYIYTVETNSSVKWGKLLHSSELILTQYTGLKDKSGVEIYEGDIIYRNSTDEKLEVVFSKIGCWSFENKDFRYYTTNMNIKNQSLSTCEVIGNIFENPELLKNEK